MGRLLWAKKNLLKGTAPTNYRPITCRPMIRKILWAQIKKIPLTDKPWKGYRKRNIGTEELLYIDQHILNESKTRWKNLAIACIDNKIAYDMVLQSWIPLCVKLYKIPHQVLNFMENTMQIWWDELTPRGQSLAEVKIQRVIIQGEALSPFLFLITMMLLNYLLRKFTAKYKYSKLVEKIKHLMYMDHVNLFPKTKKNRKP